MSDYIISICTGFLSRALGFAGTIFLTRLLPLDVLGLLTLVQTSAQTTSSLFRLGSNYSYTVLLPSREVAKVQLLLAISYSRLGVFLSLPFSIIVSVYTAGSIWTGDNTYISEYVNLWTLLLVVLLITISECLSELLWSVIFPLRDLMNTVLYRDPLVSALKIALPLLFYSAWGLSGILISVLAINCISMLGAMRVGNWFSLRIFYASIFVGKISDMIELLRYGCAGYIFPLLTNLLMLPILLQSASTEGVVDIGALRIGTWGAQIITVIGGSIAPVLLVKNSRNQKIRQQRNQIADLCAVIYSLLFAIACFSVGYINETLFLGKYSGYENLQLIVVAGAVVQSLVQLLLQTPLRPSQQLRLNVTLCLALLVSFCIVRLLLTDLLLTSYALVPLASNILFMIVLLFSRTLKSDLAISNTTASYLALGCLSLIIDLAFGNNILTIATALVWAKELIRMSLCSRKNRSVE